MKQLSQSDVQQVSGGQDDGTPGVGAIVGPLPYPLPVVPPYRPIQGPIGNEP